MSLGLLVVFVNKLPSHPLFDTVVGIVFAILLFGLGIPALVLGIVGARRSARLGAVALAAWSILDGVLAILVGIAVTTAVVLAVAAT